MEYFYNKNIKNNKHSLVKKSITGLFALNLLTLSLTACSVEKKFEYDQEKDASLSNQYEDFSNHKLSPKLKTQLNSLRPYEIAVDEYNDLLSVDATDKDIVTARVDIINDARSVINAATAIIEIKAIEKLELSNNATFEYINNGNSVDGPNYKVKIVDGNDSYEIEKLPIKVSKMLNLIDAIKAYKGTGESKSWDKAIDGYIERTEELYYLTLDVASDTTIDFKIKEDSKKR